MLPRRTLTHTNLHVSVLGYGASPLGGVFGQVELKDGVAAVHHAFARGMNLFDTSPYYGDTRSEVVLGAGLKDLPRSEIVVCTKVGRYGASEFDFSARRVTESIDESLARLQLSYIDIVYCHDVEFGNLDQVLTEALPTLDALRRAGKIRHVGISGLPLDYLRRVIEMSSVKIDVILSYCHFCINDTTLLDHVDFFNRHAIDVINASPLAMGLWTPQGPPSWHPGPKPLLETAEAVREFCVERRMDVSRFALQEVLKEERIPTTLVGLRTIDEVDRNINAALHGLEEEMEGADEVRRMLEPVMGMSWPSGN